MASTRGCSRPGGTLREAARRHTAQAMKSVWGSPLAAGPRLTHVLSPRPGASPYGAPASTDPSPERLPGASEGLGHELNRLVEEPQHTQNTDQQECPEQKLSPAQCAQEQQRRVRGGLESQEKPRHQRGEGQRPLLRCGAAQAHGRRSVATPRADASEPTQKEVAHMALPDAGRLGSQAGWARSCQPAGYEREARQPLAHSNQQHHAAAEGASVWARLTPALPTTGATSRLAEGHRSGPPSVPAAQRMRAGTRAARTARSGAEALRGRVSCGASTGRATCSTAAGRSPSPPGVRRRRPRQGRGRSRRRCLGRASIQTPSARASPRWPWPHRTCELAGADTHTDRQTDARRHDAKRGWGVLPPRPVAQHIVYRFTARTLRPVRGGGLGPPPPPPLPRWSPRPPSATARERRPAGTAARPPSAQ
eukprot:scaffold3884_cov392-Prasinococcus_capsulatus_cf.AAC.16